MSKFRSITEQLVTNKGYEISQKCRQLDRKDDTIESLRIAKKDLVKHINILECYIFLLKIEKALNEKRIGFKSLLIELLESKQLRSFFTFIFLLSGKLQSIFRKLTNSLGISRRSPDFIEQLSPTLFEQPDPTLFEQPDLTLFKRELRILLRRIEKKTTFKISLLHPRRLAKGCSSAITVQIYLPYKEPEAIYRIAKLKNESLQLENSELDDKTYSSTLIPGLTVIIKLFSPVINFSDEVLKELQGEYVNRVTFTAKPDNECTPGRQTAVLSIRDSKTNKEYESISFSFIVDDFAFDHISKPILSYVSSGVTGISSLALFTLSFLQKVDATLGIPAGTVGAALAFLLGFRPTFLYKNEVKTEGK